MRAETAAMARVIAGRLDTGPERTAHVGNESLGPTSGLDDEKLYWVREIDPASAGVAEVEGAPAVLRSELLEPAPPGALSSR